MHTVMTHQTQLLQATRQALGPPIDHPLDLDQTNRDYSDDDFDLNLFGVTIHNFRQGGTVLEK
jgi:hypothetical protein